MFNREEGCRIQDEERRQRLKRAAADCGLMKAWGSDTWGRAAGGPDGLGRAATAGLPVHLTAVYYEYTVILQGFSSSKCRLFSAVAVLECDPPILVVSALGVAS